MREEYEGRHSHDIVSSDYPAMLHHIGIYLDYVDQVSHGECYALEC